MTTEQKSIFDNECLAFTLELILGIPMLAICTPVGWLASLCAYLYM